MHLDDPTRLSRRSVASRARVRNAMLRAGRRVVAAAAATTVVVAATVTGAFPAAAQAGSEPPTTTPTTAPPPPTTTPTTTPPSTVPSTTPPTQTAPAPAEPEPAPVPTPARPVPPAAVLVEQPPPTDLPGLAALAARAEVLLHTRTDLAALRGDVVPGQPGDPATDPSLGTAELEYEWVTVRSQLARGIAARTFRSPLTILADWDRTPPETLRVMFFALSQLGKGVQYGQSGPERYDSSGLTMVAWARAGVALPHFSKAQLAALPRVARDATRPGDLVVYGLDGRRDVGLYVGSGLVVMAASDTVAVDFGAAMADDVTGVVRPAGELSPGDRDPLAAAPPLPMSAQARSFPRGDVDPVGPLATSAVSKLDSSLRLDVQNRVRTLARSTRATLAAAVTRADAVAGVPAALVPVYQSAAATCPAPVDWWSVIAAIGAHESGHGTAGGSSVGRDGTTSPPIYGPRLDGSGTGGNTVAMGDTDGGRWDADPEYDRAVGPMQFIPSTWARHAVRAPERGPGDPDPQNIYDAIYSAAAYLCAAQRGSVTDARAAVLSYNHSESYADKILDRAAQYAGSTPAASQVPAPTTEPAADDSGSRAAAAVDARSALSSQTGATATEIAERFGVDPAALLDEWRYAPVAALRTVLWAVGGVERPDGPRSDAFVAAAWRQGGVTLPEKGDDLAASTTEIDGSQLRPGDLVIVGPLGATDHVSLYVGAGIAVHTTGSGGRAELAGYDPIRLARFARVNQPGVLSPGLGFLLRPVSGPIVSGYGARRHPVYGDTRFHHGLDIDAAAGDPIHAAAAGVVVVASVQGGYGNAVMVDHGNGLATWYAHMSKIDVAVGDVVATGDVLGEVGSTGVSTGPHLHFEVRVFGHDVDPTLYLSPRAGDRVTGAASG